MATLEQALISAVPVLEKLKNPLLQQQSIKILRNFISNVHLLGGAVSGLAFVGDIVEALGLGAIDDEPGKGAVCDGSDENSELQCEGTVG